jgi:NAD(P)-dependent dehydrogenase (short-subunit alcohol dehydrogenase family)
LIEVNNKFNLDGKTAVITGGGGLLGSEHAIALLQHGATVLLTDINSNSLDIAVDVIEKHFSNSSIRNNLKPVIMDVTSPDSIRSVSDDMKGRIDILINNAAIDPKQNKESSALNHSRLESFSLAQWNLELDVGLTGAFLCCKEFGTKMHLDGMGGVILNISSDLSVIAPNQKLYKKFDRTNDQQPVKPITYSVLKTGLIGLTRYISTYWNESNIRCNALSPGGVQHQQNQDFVKNISDLIPLGRMANKDEYHAAIQFLCSDASSYMTGQNIIIDGGRSVW